MKRYNKFLYLVIWEGPIQTDRKPLGAEDFCVIGTKTAAQDKEL
jgi:hypothetical protein